MRSAVSGPFQALERAEVIAMISARPLYNSRGSERWVHHSLIDKNLAACANQRDDEVRHTGSGLFAVLDSNAPQNFRLLLFEQLNLRLI
jgi:hypothetical protein